MLISKATQAQNITVLLDGVKVNATRLRVEQEPIEVFDRHSCGAVQFIAGPQKIFLGDQEVFGGKVTDYGNGVTEDEF